EDGRPPLPALFELGIGGADPLAQLRELLAAPIADPGDVLIDLLRRIHEQASSSNRGGCGEHRRGVFRRETAWRVSPRRSCTGTTTVPRRARSGPASARSSGGATA